MDIFYTVDLNKLPFNALIQISIWCQKKHSNVTTEISNIYKFNMNPISIYEINSDI